MRTLPVIVVLGCLFVSIFAEEESVLSCQEHRQKALASSNEYDVIPECDEDGSYAGLQCKKDQSLCFCYRKDGTLIGDKDHSKKACACPRARDEVLSRGRLIGRYVPQCQDDGTYRRTQCWGSVGSCWCVDESGRRLDKPVSLNEDC